VRRRRFARAKRSSRKKIPVGKRKALPERAIARITTMRRSSQKARSFVRRKTPAVVEI
jgi:hypothetical protein